MAEPIHCPDCGHWNAAEAQECAACHFPLTERGPVTHAPPPPPPAAALPLRPFRPRRPRPQSNVALSIWLGVGAFLALILVVIALQATHERASAPVEGSNADQQKESDLFRATLAKDSTNAQARVGLANILFDTGNWTEAIVHYRSAVRQDSSLVPAIVDMGVCYFNLSDTDQAERLFLLALARDPHQPYALFNLGIVYERLGKLDEALKNFHRALESAPPEAMKQALVEAIGRVAKQTGKTAPPLTQPK